MNDALRLMQGARDAVKDVRRRIEELTRSAVTKAEAIAQHAQPITYSYSLRQLDQCAMLISAVDNDFHGKNVVLVKTPKGIELWRVSNQPPKRARRMRL